MADKLVIQKKNEAILTVSTDFGVGAELRDFFSFYVPGYKFMPAYKNKVWDGKIYLYNQQAQELPVGLLPYVTNFAAKRHYEVEFVDGPYGLPENYNKVDPKKIMTFIDSLELKSCGEKIQIRDYQFNAICESIRRKRVILLSPTGSGKSLIIYVLLRWYLKNHDNKVLVIVPTTSLVQQMYSDFADYSDNDPSFNAKEDCHVIYSGQPKTNINERVFISTWQSIYKLSMTWFNQFGAIFGDECHGFKSKSLSSIMNKSRDVAYRFGTTGTLDGTQTHQLVLEGLFGKTMKVTTTKNLQDKDTLANLDIKLLNLKYDKETCKACVGNTYQKEIDFIVKYNKRNKFITNLALDQNGNTLVLFQYVEKHGRPLFNMIADKAHEKRKVFFVSGQTDTVDREAIRKITESQKDAIIVASFGTFSTGINIKNLHNIIFASPSKSQIRVLQSIGRGLRKSENNETTILYDLIDDLQHKSKKNYCLKHGEERVKIYNKEEFKSKLYKVDL